MSLNLIFIVTSSLLLTANAFSQASAQTKSVAATQAAQIRNMPFSIMLNGSNFLLSGAGLKGTYRIHPMIAVGLVGGASSIRPTEADLKAFPGYNYHHRLTYFGIVSDIYLTNFSEANKLYATVGFTNANVKTSVDDTYIGFGSNSSEAWQRGMIFSLGWQFKHPLAIADNVGLITQLGLGYGNGNRINYNLSGTRTSLSDGMILDLKAGLIF